MLFAPPAGLSLQQHPGAAWVVVRNSSISDFVAGVEPLSLLRSHVVAAKERKLPVYGGGETDLVWLNQCVLKLQLLVDWSIIWSKDVSCQHFFDHLIFTSLNLMIAMKILWVFIQLVGQRKQFGDL